MSMLFVLYLIIVVLAVICINKGKYPYALGLAHFAGYILCYYILHLPILGA